MWPYFKIFESKRIVRILTHENLSHIPGDGDNKRPVPPAGPGHRPERAAVRLHAAAAVARRGPRAGPAAEVPALPRQEDDGGRPPPRVPAAVVHGSVLNT